MAVVVLPSAAGADDAGQAEDGAALARRAGDHQRVCVRSACRDHTTDGASGEAGGWNTTRPGGPDRDPAWVASSVDLLGLVNDTHRKREVLDAPCDWASSTFADIRLWSADGEAQEGSSDIRAPVLVLVVETMVDGLGHGSRIRWRLAGSA